MIQEEYITLETAKLAKEKGFNELVDTLYKDGIFKFNTSHTLSKFPQSISNNGLSDKCFSAPTKYILERWLRERHNVNIAVYPTMSYYRNVETTKYAFTRFHKAVAKFHSDITYETHDEAFEAALQNALNYIEKE